MVKRVTAAELGRILSQKADDVPEAVMNAIVDTGLRLQGDLVQREIAKTTPHQPVDQAQYKGSWRGHRTALGYLVYNLSKQALWIERGRAPGGKPGAIYRILLPWARRKRVPRGVVWPLAVRIALEGYRPRWVLRRASHRVRPILRANIRRALGQHLSER